MFHLLSDVAALIGSPSASFQGERVSFTDSESYSDSEPPSPPPPGRGKAVAGASGRRRRTRRRPRVVDGFMAAARHAHPQATSMAVSPPTSPRRRTSPSAHSARALAVPDADGFYEVRSRRRWRRRSPLRESRLVPVELQGLCFNCLAANHVKRDCVFPVRCFNCHQEGHRSFAWPLPPGRGKRARSPPRAGHSRRVAAR